VRVPGLVVWPGGIPHPRRVSAPASVLDILPTVAEVLGVDPEPRGALDGVNLLGALRGGGAGGRPPDAPLTFVSPRAAAIQGGGHKAIRPAPQAAWELYDLGADPGETADLAAERPGVLTDLVARYEAWREEAEADRRP
jgi:arylsulfatase A-like enzyme